MAKFSVAAKPAPPSQVAAALGARRTPAPRQAHSPPGQAVTHSPAARPAEGICSGDGAVARAALGSGTNPLPLCLVNIFVCVRACVCHYRWDSL